MTQTVRRFSLRRPLPSPAREERDELLQELARTRVLTNQAYASFNLARDSELIESYVYEISALQARYNYLLRRVKQLEELL